MPEESTTTGVWALLTGAGATIFGVVWRVIGRADLQRDRFHLELQAELQVLRQRVATLESRDDDKDREIAQLRAECASLRQAVASRDQTIADLSAAMRQTP